MSHYFLDRYCVVSFFLSQSSPILATVIRVKSIRARLKRMTFQANLKSFTHGASFTVFKLEGSAALEANHLTAFIKYHLRINQAPSAFINRISNSSAAFR